jgi:hypothetical protein
VAVAVAVLVGFAQGQDCPLPQVQLTQLLSVLAGPAGHCDAAVQGSDGNPSEFNTITSTGGGGGGGGLLWQAQKMVDQGVLGRRRISNCWCNMEQAALETLQFSLQAKETMVVTDLPDGATFDGGGGGGGATDPGSNATTPSGGNGGAGTASAISGVSPSPFYAGGGGGSGISSKSRLELAVQVVVGRQCSQSTGVANTGGGGGGEGVNPQAVGTGGSGIVILKYLVPVGTTVTHIYKGSGSWVAPTGVTAIDWLIVAGGGGGGGDYGWWWWCRWL